MNRAEYRRQMKNSRKPAPVYHPNPIKLEVEREYTKLREQITKDSSEKALIFTLAIPIKVLHDKYGWGAKKRLKDFAIAMTEEYQRFNDGNMTLSEYAAMVYEYYGIKFELGDKSEDSGK